MLATDGDFFLGGDDIDRAIAEFLAAEMNRQQQRRSAPRPRGLMTRLMLAAEEIKCHLSEHDAAEGAIDGLMLPAAAQLEHPVPAHPESARGADRAASSSAPSTSPATPSPRRASMPRSISEIVCVGGSTRIPLVRQRLAELFGREPAMRDQPRRGRGAGRRDPGRQPVGQPVPRRRPCRPRDAVPTAALSPLGARRRAVGGGGRRRRARSCSTSPRPACASRPPAATPSRSSTRTCRPRSSARETFTTARDHQTQVVIDCCRGESRRYAENEPLGPPGARRPAAAPPRRGARSTSRSASTATASCTSGPVTPTPASARKRRSKCSAPRRGVATPYPRSLAPWTRSWRRSGRPRGQGAP